MNRELWLAGSRTASMKSWGPVLLGQRPGLAAPQPCSCIWGDGWQLGLEALQLSCQKLSSDKATSNTWMLVSIPSAEFGGVVSMPPSLLLQPWWCLSSDGCLCQNCHLPGCSTASFFLFLPFFPPACINLVSFNLITFFPDRLSQEQCKWALKHGDLVYICQLIAWVAQTSRAGTCLFALRFTFDFRSDAVPRRRFPDGEQGCCLWAVFCSWW